jgi:hypothetical protein
LSNKSNETFIRQEYALGDICEFDWGEVKLDVDGKGYKKYQLAVFTSAYGNYRYSLLFETQDTVAFHQSHAMFFEHIGRTYNTMVYDNMKVAVAKFVGRTEKEATIALKQLSVYYGFKFRFCNIRSGNEKGHVENSVDFVRRKAFSANDNFEVFELACQQLSEKLNKYNNVKTKYLGNVSPMELLKEEQKHLLPSVPEYINCECVTAKVDKLGTISYLQNRYSVPDYLVQKRVDVRVYINKIEIYFNNSLVATHTRLNGNQEWSIDIFHFRKTLTKKPGALCNSIAFEQMNNILKQIYQKHFKSMNKDFIQLLNLVGENNINEITKIVNILEKQKVTVTLDTIKMILNRNNEPINITSSISQMQKQIEEYSREHLKQYDAIVGTSGVKEVVTV